MPSSPISPEIAVVVPLRDEAGCVGPVIAEILEALADGPAFEVVAVDDGSTDGTGEALAELSARHPALRVLRHARSAGKSAAIHNGVLAARAGTILTIDGDGQNPARDLPRLAAALEMGGRVGLVAGQRAVRRTSLPKRLASRAANALRARLLGDGTRDAACGMKAFRREPFLALPYFDTMHRFLPALFRAAGAEVRHVEVGDRPRLSGRSKYTNWGRAVTGAADLVGVLWLLRRRKKALAVAVLPASRPVAPHLRAVERAD
jgi:dolichol-phosphate mannosyltransferase